MLPAQVFTELLRLAGRVGITVRMDAFDLKVIEGKGGLCWLRGKPTVVLDAGAPLLDRVGILAEALSAFDLEALYLPPFLRAGIEARRTRTGGALAAPAAGGATVGATVHPFPSSAPGAKRPRPPPRPRARLAPAR